MRKPAALAPLSYCSPALPRLRARPVTVCSKRIYALEQGLPALEACGLNVLVQDLLEQVMHWHFVLLAAFFTESQSPTRVLPKSISYTYVNFYSLLKT